MVIRSSYLFGLTLVSVLLSACSPNPVHESYICESKVNNASYTGEYKGVENNLKPSDLAEDVFCADKFKKGKYPNGFLTIFGSSKISETNSKATDGINKANNDLYANVKKFAYLWTKAYGKKYPILTGAGPGIMEAGSRGAVEASGPSIGYTTYYGPVASRGNPNDAFAKYHENQIITDGLIFSSVAIREYSMIRDSAAIVIAPGGMGSEWEISQTIETIKSQQLNSVPIYMIGDKEIHWETFSKRLERLNELGTLSVNAKGSTISIGTPGKDNVVIIEFINDPTELMGKLKSRLRLE